MSESTTETTPKTVTLRSSTNTELVNDRRKGGWELIEDTPVEDNPELELVEFLEEGELSVTGGVMFDRAKKLGNRAGQQHLERLLAQQESIPKEWRPYYLVAPGTQWCNYNDSLYVPCLDYRDGRWDLIWDWLAYQWGPTDRLVRCK